MANAAQGTKFDLVAIMSSAAGFKNLIDSFKDLVKDVNFDCNESGIQVQTTDSSNVCLVHMMMRESAFESFTCAKNMTLGLNAESLGKVLKLCGSTDKCILKVVDEPRKVTFTFESADDDRVSHFDMKTVEIDTEALGIPDQLYDTVISMPSGEFKKALTDLKDVGDQVTMGVSKEGLRMEVSGDIGTGFVLLKPKEGAKEEEALSITMTEDITASFTMRYLNLFTRGTNLSKRCQLSLKSGEPMVLQYHLGEEQHGFIRFLLAPKLDD